MDEVINFLLFYTSGKYGFVIELFLCELIFTLPVKCRKYAFVTLPLSVIAYFAFGFYCPVISVPYLRATVICLMIFAVSVALQFICFDLPIKRVIFNSSAAYIMQSLALNAKEMFRIVTGWGGVFASFAKRCSCWPSSPPVIFCSRGAVSARKQI